MPWRFQFSGPARVAGCVSLLTCLLLGCGASHSTPTGDAAAGDIAMTPPPADVTRTALVDHELWVPVEAADDPFGDRPAQVNCSITGYAAEDLGGEPAFGVAMRDCDYMTAVQPSLTDVIAGDEIKVRFWYFTLTSDDPSAEAHAAIQFDGHMDWEVIVPIPQPEGGLVSETFIAERDYPAGTPLHYHVHNHGLNEYYLVELSRTDR